MKHLSPDTTQNAGHQRE